MELFYLNPKYFKPDISIINSYGISATDKFYILRFISWNASHDIGQKGLSFASKIQLVQVLEKYGRVLISSESSLPPELANYQIKIRPEHLHHFLAFSSLYIGEGSTTASECAVLGTPSIYVNTLQVSNCIEQEEKYNLCYNLIDSDLVIKKALEIITDENAREKYQKRRRAMLKDKIDGTGFLVWFIKNYPLSEKVMRKDPEFQLRFK
jgi:predicted glycosyltransferase